METLKLAWTTLKKHQSQVLILWILGILFYIPTKLYTASAQDQQTITTEMILLVLWSGISTVWISSAALHYAYQSLQRREGVLKASLAHTFYQIPALILIASKVFMLTLISSFFLIVPGIYVMTAFSQALTLYILRDDAPSIQVFGLSRALVKKMFWFILAFNIVSLAFEVAFALLTSSDQRVAAVWDFSTVSVELLYLLSNAVLPFVSAAIFHRLTSDAQEFDSLLSTFKRKKPLSPLRLCFEIGGLSLVFAVLLVGGMSLFK